MELCEGATSDVDKLEAIFSFVNEQIRYDYVKAFTVQSNYLPDVDQTLHAGTGICFDYVALFACMLRVQGIPTKLVVGKLLISDPPVEHAWNKVRMDDTWFLIDPTFGAYYKQAQYLEQHAY
jgi:transglutaminase-like putative cysteine protease